MQEKEWVIKLLSEAKEGIKEEDINRVRLLSNKTLHSASIYQDPDNISLAVILYALSKILERQDYREYKHWDIFAKAYTSSVDKAIADLRKGDIEHYRKHIEEVRSCLRRIYGPLKKYIPDVFRKAQINKASRLYEHGLSLEKTAKILGITVWELNQYVGQTGIADLSLSHGIDIKLRIKFAEDIFR